MTRIDRLPDRLEARACRPPRILGREFSLRLLGALWGGSGGVGPAPGGAQAS